MKDKKEILNKNSCEREKEIAKFSKEMFVKFANGEISYELMDDKVFGREIIESLQGSVNKKLIDALELMSEFDAARKILPAEKVEKSKQEILALLDDVLEENGAICPVCGEYVFENNLQGDICRVCFWENDLIDGGANELPLEDYKKWWKKVESTLPPLMKKFNIDDSKEFFCGGRYRNMVVPRENIDSFVREMTKAGLKIELNYFNICEKLGLDYRSFVSRPNISRDCSVKENNEACLKIIFSKDPEKVCEKFHFEQLLQLLKKSKNSTQLWQELTPAFSIEHNPTKV